MSVTVRKHATASPRWADGKAEGPAKSRGWCFGQRTRVASGVLSFLLEHAFSSNNSSRRSVRSGGRGPSEWVGRARTSATFPGSTAGVLTLSPAESQGNTQPQPQPEPEERAHGGAHGALPVGGEPSVHPSIQPLLSFSTHTGHPTCSDPRAAPCPVHGGPVSCKAGQVLLWVRGQLPFPCPPPGASGPATASGLASCPQDILTGRHGALTAGLVTHSSLEQTGTAAAGAKGPGEGTKPGRGKPCLQPRGVRAGTPV